MIQSTLTTTASEFVPDNTNRHSIIISNPNTASSVYIGQDSTLTATNGTPILAGGNLTEDSGGTRMYKGPYWGITSSGSVTVTYWERTQ